MGNLIEIQSQIEKLQKQAAEIKTREFDKTVKEILAKMQAFGITLRDLQQAVGKSRKTAESGRRSASVKKGAAKRAGAKTTGKTGARVAAKYRGPNGETWSGRGLMPRWLATLVEQGRKKEDFSIQG